MGNVNPWGIKIKDEEDELNNFGLSLDDAPRQNLSNDSKTNSQVEVGSGPVFALPVLPKKEEPSKWKKFLLVFLVVLVVSGAGYYLRDYFQNLQASLMRKYYGASDQCVGYVKRFYKNVFNIDIGYVGVARNMFKLAGESGLKAHENGGTVAPQPGDILVYDHSNKVGHVAIITDVVKDGVMIMEQNWVPSVITNNHGQPFFVKVENGHYTMPNREGTFKVMGWLSRTADNPGTQFNFGNNAPKGWIASDDDKAIDSIDETSWTVQVAGQNPAVLGPVYWEGLSTAQVKTIIFRARVTGGDNLAAGVYLRDMNDVWSAKIPTQNIEGVDGFYTFKADLTAFGSDFRFKELKLRLSEPSVIGKEKWELDWLNMLGE